MKLAEEIRKALVESGISLVRLETDDGRPVTVRNGGTGSSALLTSGKAYGVANETIIAIIAAELEPARAAFAEWMEAATTPGFDNLRRVDARRRAEVALAMLSEGGNEK